MDEYPKILVWTWTDPDKLAGSPAILAKMMEHVPPGRAEIICERGGDAQITKETSVKHPITKIRFHRWVWPIPRGTVIQRVVQYAGIPFMVVYGLWRIARFRPDCLLTIFINDIWILSSYLLSIISRVPVIYYVHDAYRENASSRGVLAQVVARLLEPRAFRHGRVVTLHDKLQSLYFDNYQINSDLLRHPAQHPPLPRSNKRSVDGVKTVGFAGTIYEMNINELVVLAQTIEANPRLQLKIWSGANAQKLAATGIAGDRTRVIFEPDYGLMLAALSECDLLYLPLAFNSGRRVLFPGAGFSFLTKAVDYLTAGPPILVHAPNGYAINEFFEAHSCGYLLEKDGAKALDGWLTRWLNGDIPPTPEEARQKAVDLFSPASHEQAFRHILDEVVRQKLTAQDYSSREKWRTR